MTGVQTCALPIGHFLGRAHFFRERGATYTEGMRTSLQAGLLGAGVAKGAGFTDSGWAITLGVGMVLGIEATKILMGWFDRRIGAIHAQLEQSWVTNPATVRQIELLEGIHKALTQEFELLPDGPDWPDEEPSWDKDKGPDLASRHRLPKDYDPELLRHLGLKQ